MRKIILTTVIAAALLTAGCEDDKKPKDDKRCQSHCPRCGARCVYPIEKDKHVDEVFGGKNYHKAGDKNGDHVWDFNGKYVGNIIWVTK
jgi:hypothetical protein